MKQNLPKLIFSIKTWILVILIIVGFVYFGYIIPNSIASENDLNDYSNAYLAEYNSLIEHYFGIEQGSYFKFYGNYPYNIKSIVSEQNGVAIEMIPSSTGSYDSKITSDKIENAVFEMNLFNNPRIHIPDGTNFTIFNWDGRAGEAMFVLNNDSHVGMSNIVINTNQGRFIDFINSELQLNEMVINNVYYPYVYLNSCIKKKCWTKELAKQRAYDDLKEYGLSDGFILAFNSNEFKEYFARPELESLIKDMVYKKRYDPNYNSYKYDNDIKNLDNIGISKYKISNEFINKTINFVDGKYVSRKPLSGRN